jgi:hypothetical protein
MSRAIERLEHPRLPAAANLDARKRQPARAEGRGVQPVGRPKSDHVDAVPLNGFSFSKVLFSPVVQSDDLIAFANRDWEAIAVSKRRRWVMLRSQMTPAQALTVGDELREHMNTLRPGWPGHAERHDDAAVHIRVSEALRSVKPLRRR